MRRRIGAFIDKTDPQLYARLFWIREFTHRRHRELRTVRRLVRRGHQVADVGANRGLHALYFRSLVGGDGTVHMFEPNPMEYHRLALLAHRYGNLRFYPYGLSSTSCASELHVPVVNGVPLTTRGSVVNRSEDGDELEIPVSLKRLDDVAPAFSRRLDMIKCDVEGYELDVVEGAQQTLAEHRPILLIEIEKRYCGEGFDAIMTLLADLGFEGFFFRGDCLLPLSTFDLDRDQVAYYGPSRGSGFLPATYVRDFLFVPRENVASV